MQTPLRALILEDRLTDARLVIHELEQAGFELSWERVETEVDFLEKLQSVWDVVLADYNMPQFGAIRALELLRDHHSQIPLIIVSGTIGEETAVAAMKQGAADYLLKDRLGRLGQAVTQAVEQHRLRKIQAAAESSIRAGELRFQAVFKQLQLQIRRMPIAYILFDADFTIVDWNPAAEQIFGFRKEEVMGWGPPFAAITPEQDWHLQEQLMDRIRQGDMVAHSADKRRTKEGQTIDCEWLNTPLQAEDGQFSGLMSLVQDVTERKRLEEQFRQAQKMEAVGRLAGGIAHDFNNMLTIILGYSEHLREIVRTGDPVREPIEQIHAAGSRAARLTRQLLAFSRKQVLIPTTANINLLVMDMETMIGRLLGEDIQLELRLDEKLGLTKVDVGQFEQILMNLAVNARDAMPQGGGLLIETANQELDAGCVLTHESAHSGSHVLLRVSDTGCGMNAETLARIFEPFFSTKGQSGTGLGLATVYGIVKQSGGHITVRSQPGMGTAFEIFLPRESSPDSMQVAAVKNEGKLLGTETILLVEDVEGVRTLARVALQRHGYHVLEAANGIVALQQSDRYPGKIDLLATDVVMPQMSGRELAERLSVRRPGIEVLYMSGYMDDAIVRHGLEHSEVPFLQKPYTTESLARTIRELLDKRQAF
jgi:two-component system, cell cycle sensor histidine kinase and response regulator CckA